MLEIAQIPVLDDNYVYLIHDTETGNTAVVDPSVAAPVLEEANKRNWKITHILNTHHHYDHVDGNQEIIQKTGAIVVGAAHDAERIPGISRKVSEGDIVEIGQSKARVIDLVGHTTGHIAYYFEQDNALFCGDTLFALGCGRVFEGTMSQMWNSLKKLKSLPDATQVYCAHEYTSSNAAFALSVDPENPELLKRVEEINLLRSNNKPTVPFSLGIDKQTNPFLRADHPVFAKLTDQSTNSDAVFTALRTKKDNF